MTSATVRLPLVRPSLWRRFWSRWNEKEGYVFILPSLILLLVFTFAPLVFSLYLSLHRWTVPSPSDAPYVGTTNYEFVLEDRFFWRAMRNSMYYAVLAVPLGMAVSLAIAVILNQRLPGVNIFRALFFLPVISSWVAVSVIWLYLLEPQTGLINQFLLNAFKLRGPNWLGDPNLAMITVVMVATWKNMGFSMVIWLAGLQGIPLDLYDAAEVDGASRWQQFRYVTLPMLAPTTAFLSITGVIGALQVFTPIWVMTKGGPIGSTDVIVYRIFVKAFQEFNFGVAAAMSWLLFVVIFTLTVAQLFYQKRHIERTFG
jgi:multiple sugar transport system permease protein